MTDKNQYERPDDILENRNHRSKISLLLCICLAKRPKDQLNSPKQKHSRSNSRRHLGKSYKTVGTSSLKLEEHLIVEVPSPVVESHDCPLIHCQLSRSIPAIPHCEAKDDESSLQRQEDYNRIGMPSFAKRRNIPEHILIGQAKMNSVTDDDADVELTTERSNVDGLTWQFNPTPTDPAKYSGPVIYNDIPHGRGVLEFESGDWYDGPFHMGFMHGNDGILTTAHGSIYVGGFCKNVKHGHGKLTIPGKLQCYEGNYEWGIPHGYGMAISADGSLFHQGQWEYGKPSHPMLQWDEASMISASIRVPCDASMPSIDPRISRYDPFRKLVFSDDEETNSMNSEGCFSELTSSIVDGDSASYCGDEEDSLYGKMSSILDLGPVNDHNSIESLRKHAPMTAKEMTKYSSLKASFDDHRRRERTLGVDASSNVLDPTELYRSAYDEGLAVVSLKGIP